MFTQSTDATNATAVTRAPAPIRRMDIPLKSIFRRRPKTSLSFTYNPLLRPFGRSFSRREQESVDAAPRHRLQRWSRGTSATTFRVERVLFPGSQTGEGQFPMVDKLQNIWLDGEFVPWDEARVHVLTHSLHYGLGAFEGIRAYKRASGGTYVFRLREHIDRLFDSCKMTLLTPKFNREQIAQACLDTLQKNAMAEGYLRPMVFVGEGAMGIYAPNNPVRATVIAWKWGAYLGEEALKKGIRAKISSFARHHINVSLAKGKIMGQYTGSVLAKREAKLGGYDEAILLDPQGYVSEGSGENIFIVKRSVLHTPDLSSSILEGITRDTILTIAREEGIPVHEGRITRDQLWLADETFLTGTAAEVTPVREVDDRTIGDGAVGARDSTHSGTLLRDRPRRRYVAPRVAHQGGVKMWSDRRRSGAGFALTLVTVVAGCGAQEVRVEAPTNEAPRPAPGFSAEPTSWGSSTRSAFSSRCRSPTVARGKSTITSSRCWWPRTRRTGSRMEIQAWYESELMSRQGMRRTGS